MEFTKWIEAKPTVMLGKPVIKGTRITVELILRKIADKYTFEEIIAMYPRIEEVHIWAVINYAAAVVENEEVIKAA